MNHTLAIKITVSQSEARTDYPITT